MVFGLGNSPQNHDRIEDLLFASVGHRRWSDPRRGGKWQSAETGAIKVP
jgi:hypothetical protein